MRGHEQASSTEDDNVLIEIWPRRRRVAGDMAGLTSSGCTTYWARLTGAENGFHNGAPPVRDGARESLSQRREREFARALRLRLGPGAWQALHEAYADEIREALEDDNRPIDRRKTTDVDT
jgi:hypothetical protein